MMAAVATLWEREVIRFVRQRSRWWGRSCSRSSSGAARRRPVRVVPAGGRGRRRLPPVLLPGVLALVLLFTAIFATISTVEDRRAGFLQGVLAAPVPRTAIVLGQALGGATLAVLQGLLFLALAPVAGVSLDPARVAAATGAMGFSRSRWSTWGSSSPGASSRRRASTRS